MSATITITLSSTFHRGATTTIRLPDAGLTAGTVRPRTWVAALRRLCSSDSCQCRRRGAFSARGADGHAYTITGTGNGGALLERID